MILWIPAAAAALASALFTALDAAGSFARMEPQERAQPASPGDSSVDEARFVERLRRGDDDAFESLVRDHAGRMLAVAKRFLPNEEDAMDAVQESFLSVHKSIERFSGGSKLSTWVHRIVVNSCLMKLRTKRPLWARVVAGEDQAKLTHKPGQVLWLHTPGRCLVELLPADPRRTDYRLSIELTTEAHSAKVRAGLYVAHREGRHWETPPGAGGQHAFVEAAFPEPSEKGPAASLYFTFALALLVVFLVLAAQFESWIHPLIIMLAVPLAVTGGLGALYFTGISLNVYSQIGMILLIGLMAKNGILIVEFANQLRDEGRSVRDAVLEAVEHPRNPRQQERQPQRVASGEIGALCFKRQREQSAGDRAATNGRGVWAGASQSHPPQQTQTIRSQLDPESCAIKMSRRKPRTHQRHHQPKRHDQPHQFVVDKLKAQRIFLPQQPRRHAAVSKAILSDADLADIYAYLQSIPQGKDYKSIPLLNQ